MNSAFLDKELSRGGTFGLYNRTDNKKIENFIITNNQSGQQEMTWEEMRRKDVSALLFIFLQKEDTLKKLSQAMADTLKEDRDGEFSSFVIAGVHDKHFTDNG